MFAVIVLFLAALAATCSATPVASNDTFVNAVVKRATRPGTASFFDTGADACGGFDQDSDPVVSLPTNLFGLQSPSPHCGQAVTIMNTQNGQVAHGVVRDECPECGISELDLSRSLFLELTPSLSAGVIPISWFFDSEGP
ncbi:hypothetical protein EIP91_005827 [Steccherinum ochraceum]|uniref:RlpA-like protein double-psi beta-barrel domain-containing protein n=1 Tax=Steccherinum ochraceum TaxID=92696 RepID=A0A4R0RCM7_9APHY|nr:hypothetical protein EIP91_005827 [Steccherinum ochraceum]